MNDNKLGKLYLCATPIGNLEDITFRVLKVLKDCDLIAAEDTRHTRKLLNYYEIKKPMVSCHEHNEIHSSLKLIEELKNGKDVALVSDAGTPGISDPGEKLVTLAIEEGLEIIPIPGPAALICALIVSGISTKRFCFEGFLPKAKKERIELLNFIAKEDRTVILYEAPHRLLKTLKELLEYFGNRKIAAVRELTKLHEQAIRGTLSEVIDHFTQTSPKGEFVLVIEGEKRENKKPELSPGSSIITMVKDLTDQGIDKKTAMRQVATQLQIGKNEVYAALIKEDEKR